MSSYDYGEEEEEDFHCRPPSPTEDGLRRMQVAQRAHAEREARLAETPLGYAPASTVPSSVPMAMSMTIQDTIGMDQFTLAQKPFYDVANPVGGNGLSDLLSSIASALAPALSSSTSSLPPPPPPPLSSLPLLLSLLVGPDGGAPRFLPLSFIATVRPIFVTFFSFPFFSPYPFILFSFC